MLVHIDYTNWRGERAIRVIKPLMISFGANEWHKEPQWLLYAFDVEKDAPRWFAMAAIHSWRGVMPQAGSATGDIFGE